MGNITVIADNSSAGTGKALTYTYDRLYRLLSASTTAATSTPYKQSFTYDPLGSLLTFTSGTSTSSYTYAGTNYANPHAPTTIGSANYGYDAVGNLTSISSVSTNKWDYRNRLTAAYSSTTPSTFFTYDEGMQRVSKGNYVIAV